MRTTTIIELDERTRFYCRESMEHDATGLPLLEVDILQTADQDDWIDAIKDKYTLRMARGEMADLAAAMLTGVNNSIVAEQDRRDLEDEHILADMAYELEQEQRNG